MIFLRWTGHGWLVPVLFVLTLFLAGVIDPAGGPGAAVVTLLGGTLHWWVGRSFNSEGTPHGRVWHNAHTFFGAPFQRGVVLYILAALVMVAVYVGQRSSPAFGWAVFAGAPIGVLIGYLLYRSRRRLRSVSDRKELAVRHGWRYKNTDPLLPRRWKDIYGRREADAMAPFGIIGGELGGLPFTAFDSEISHEATASSPKRRCRRTTWAVHLPMAYPRLVMRGVSREWLDKQRQRASSSDAGISQRDVFDMFFGQSQGPQPSSQQPPAFDSHLWEGLFGEPMQGGEELFPETANSDFGQALLTPPIRRVTVTHGLFGWQIAGRDLLFRSAEKEDSLTADEVVRVAGHLVELARLFPAELAEQYGTTPTTDIPSL